MILLVGECVGRELTRGTLECISAAESLTDRNEITLLLAGAGVSEAATQAAKFVPQVLVADMPELSQFDPVRWAGLVCEIAQQGEAECIFLPASRAGREYSPRVAVRLGASLLEDVVAVAKSGNAVRAERYSFLARVRERIESKRPTAVISTKPGAFAVADPSKTQGEQFDVDVELAPARVRITETSRENTGGVPLGEADIVVAGGRGVGSAEGFATCVEPLAVRLGAAIGATRAVVDAGWRPYGEQVGQTGKTVQPALYVAIGISGAVQHLSGMNKSRYIVAINRDSTAPIFGTADFGIVGDAAQIVPAILRQLS